MTTNPSNLVGRDPARGVPVAVTIRGQRIAQIRDFPEAEVPANQWILPGLVDMQVNGYAGTDLNGPELDTAAVLRVVERLQAVGVTRFCPTICT